MTARLAGPIGILDEHPEWSRRLLDELDRRGLPWEKIDHSSHAFDPRDRRARYSVIVNRTSPSSHTRGHKGVLFYAEALLAHYESLGIPVVNPVAAYRFEKSKALQLGLFERVGARYPRSMVVNHPIQALAALDELRLPVVVKPNVGGSGAGIVRVDSKAQLESALDRAGPWPGRHGARAGVRRADGGRDRPRRGAGRASTSTRSASCATPGPGSTSARPTSARRPRARPRRAPSSARAR